jgi:hypothetical protein
MVINMNINKDHTSTAVLRIASKNKSIDEITNVLNTKPTRCLFKGQPYSKRNPKSNIREENLWILESVLDEYEPLELHIRHLLTFLKTKAEFIKGLQLECEIDIVCSFSSEIGQGGFTLDHELLKELTENSLDLVVNLYPPERQ